MGLFLRHRRSAGDSTNSKDLMAHDVLSRNNVRVSGRGTQPMLFAHGFGCDQNMWRFVAPAFEDDYRVVRFDYVGSGKSDLSVYDPEAGRVEAVARERLRRPKDLYFPARHRFGTHLHRTG